MFQILVIDDCIEFTDMVVQLLKTAGYGATGVNKGRYGIKLLNERSFDMIITDILMPEMDGLEIICTIRKNYKHVPTIAMSSGGKIGPTTYLESALALGAKYAFQKPFDTRIFLEKVRECIITCGSMDTGVPTKN
jgi:CheY-like chemotaxis protein